MPMLTHDILLVGGGGAGLRAAIAASEVSAHLSIGVVSKVYPMRSHTVSAEGGTAAVMRDNDSLDLHARDTIFGADFLADQDAVEAFVQEVAVTFPIVLDPSWSTAQVYRVVGLPTTYLIDRAGNVVVREVGERDWMDSVSQTAVAGLLQ